ncbi:hypothetical protein IWQ60_012623 [Tieghemiomyces parasiticus]|uniref:Uncharacterized protein n=1 Tax=Tieghemiomyces parasiticus TaxID=78921 RepID=A0A9W7ZLW9_9FUNG|nr:hypothetical protein IWQ60_012623 [Tieghemiomyces parasiticus]
MRFISAALLLVATLAVANAAEPPSSTTTSPKPKHYITNRPEKLGQAKINFIYAGRKVMNKAREEKDEPQRAYKELKPRGSTPVPVAAK